MKIDLRFCTAACSLKSPTPEQTCGYQDDSPHGIKRRRRHARPARDPPDEVRQGRRRKKQEIR